MRIAFFQDLSIGVHVDLVSPSFLAFDRAVHDGTAGMDLDVQVVQFDTGGDPGAASTFARQVVLDPTFVLAVLAPFWEEPAGRGRDPGQGRSANLQPFAGERFDLGERTRRRPRSP